MLSDWESDLTDLSSEDEEYVPASKSKSKGKGKGKEEYRVVNALRLPRTTQYSTKHLYEQIIDNAIDLDPEYQRDVVWPEVKQSGLIDSILKNYYIPPIIFAITQDDDGTILRTCIDGKQRLTSIQRFIDGQICHKDSHTNQRLWYKQVGGTRRTLLPKAYCNSFASKQITCVEYEGLTNDQEREIFQRVQLGVALTPAERMKAITGPWPNLIRELQSSVLGDDGFGASLDWGQARGRDFQCLSSIVYLIDAYPLHKFPGAVQLDKWLQGTAPVPEKTRTDLFETFKIFLKLAQDDTYSSCFQKPSRISPVEFTMTGVLVYVHREKLSLRGLSEAIKKMRVTVRDEYIDIRSNGKVTKTLWNFIQKGIKNLNLHLDKGELTASQAINPPIAKSKGKKRKRVVVEDSDDEPPLAAKRPVTAQVAHPRTPSNRSAAASVLATPSTSKGVVLASKGKARSILQKPSDRVGSGVTVQQKTVTALKAKNPATPSKQAATAKLKQVAIKTPARKPSSSSATSPSVATPDSTALALSTKELSKAPAPATPGSGSQPRGDVTSALITSQPVTPAKPRLPRMNSTNVPPAAPTPLPRRVGGPSIPRSSPARQPQSTNQHSSSSPLATVLVKNEPAEPPATSTTASGSGSTRASPAQLRPLPPPTFPTQSTIADRLAPIRAAKVQASSAGSVQGGNTNVSVPAGVPRFPMANGIQGGSSSQTPALMQAKQMPPPIQTNFGGDVGLQARMSPALGPPNIAQNVPSSPVVGKGTGSSPSTVVGHGKPSTPTLPTQAPTAPVMSTRDPRLAARQSPITTPKTPNFPSLPPNPPQPSVRYGSLPRRGSGSPLTNMRNMSPISSPTAGTGNISPRVPPQSPSSLQNPQGFSRMNEVVNANAASSSAHVRQQLPLLNESGPASDGPRPPSSAPPPVPPPAPHPSTSQVSYSHTQMSKPPPEPQALIPATDPRKIVSSSILGSPLQSRGSSSTTAVGNSGNGSITDNTAEGSVGSPRESRDGSERGREGGRYNLPDVLGDKTGGIQRRRTSWDERSDRSHRDGFRERDWARDGDKGRDWHREPLPQRGGPPTGPRRGRGRSIERDPRYRPYPPHLIN